MPSPRTRTGTRFDSGDEDDHLRQRQRGEAVRDDRHAGPGRDVGGTFVNFGWVLTPLNGTVPKDGHTITVYVDSVLLGNLSTPPNLYNAYRADVSDNFPGLNNTGGPGPGEGGPVGAFFSNTTGYANGVHYDLLDRLRRLGRGDGIGSRFFNILNVGCRAGAGGRGRSADEPVSGSLDVAAFIRDLSGSRPASISTRNSSRGSRMRTGSSGSRSRR